MTGNKTTNDAKYTFYVILFTRLKSNLVTKFSQLSIKFGGLGLDVFDSLSSDGLGLLFVVPVCLGVGLSLGFKVGNNILVFPAGFSGKTANWGEFSGWLQLDLFEGRWDDDTSHLVVWGWDTLKSLKIQRHVHMYSRYHEYLRLHTRCTWILTNRTHYNQAFSIVSHKDPK